LRGIACRGDPSDVHREMADLCIPVACDMASRPPNNSTSLRAFSEYFMPVSYHDVDTLARL
jgi:hypothetical protein